LYFVWLLNLYYFVIMCIIMYACFWIWLVNVYMCIIDDDDYLFLLKWIFVMRFKDYLNWFILIFDCVIFWHLWMIWFVINWLIVLFALCLLYLCGVMMVMSNVIDFVNAYSDVNNYMFSCVDILLKYSFIIYCFRFNYVNWYIVGVCFCDVINVLIFYEFDC